MTRNHIIIFMIFLFYFGIGIFGSILFLQAIPKFAPLITFMFSVLKVVIVSWFCLFVGLISNFQSNIKNIKAIKH